MIHTFELSKEIIDVKDDDGNTISRETIFSSLINTLQLERFYRNEERVIYGTTQYANIGFPMIRVYRLKSRKEDMKYSGMGYSYISSYYMISFTVNLGMLLGGVRDPHVSIDIMSFKPDLVKAIYQEINDLVPILDTGDYNQFRVRRIDFCFDIDYYPDEYLRLISLGYSFPERKNNTVLSKDDEELLAELPDSEPDVPDDEDNSSQDKSQNVQDSIYYSRKGININIYHKGREIESRNLPSNPNRDYNFLRIEVQVKKNKLNHILSKLKKGEIESDMPEHLRQLDCIAIPDVEEYILEYYVNALTGEGMYFSQQGAIYYIMGNTRYSEKTREKMVAILMEIKKRHGIAKFLELVEDGTITQFGTVNTVKKHLRNIHNMDVNPVTIPARSKAPNWTFTIQDGKRSYEEKMLPNVLDLIRHYHKELREEKQRDLEEWRQIKKEQGME